MEGVGVGRGAVVRNAIVDKNVQVPEGAQDRRGPGPGPGAVPVSESGMMVIGKGQKIDA